MRPCGRSAQPCERTNPRAVEIACAALERGFEHPRFLAPALARSQRGGLLEPALWCGAPWNWPRRISKFETPTVLSSVAQSGGIRPPISSRAPCGGTQQRHRSFPAGDGRGKSCASSPRPGAILNGLRPLSRVSVEPLTRLAAQALDRDDPNAARACRLAPLRCDREISLGYRRGSKARDRRRRIRACRKIFAGA